MIIDNSGFHSEEIEVEQDLSAAPEESSSMSPKKTESKNSSKNDSKNENKHSKPDKKEIEAPAGAGEQSQPQLGQTDDVTAASVQTQVVPKTLPELENCTPEALADLDCPGLYINREINWLEFNARVLECALDKSAPLLEQLKFLCIFCNNLDEFFMVRVANVFRQYRNSTAPTGPDRMSPARQLADIRRRVMTLTSICQEHWRKKLQGQLADRGLKFSHYVELTEKQRRYLADYFNNEIYPVLTPQAIDPSHPFPTISNLTLNFLILLRDKSGNKHFARVRCPGNVPRLIFVPRGKEGKSYAQLGLVTNMRDTDILLLEELVQEYLGSLFPGYEVVSSGCFRITRNTDVEIEEDEADDLLQAVKDLVDQRRFGDVVRLETAHGMPADLRDFLIKKLRLKPFQVYTVRGPMAFADLISLYSADRPNLKLDNMPGHLLHLETDIFTRLREGDLLLHHPYEAFTPVLDFIQAAAVDPQVIAIKQTLYRVGSNSPIVKSLVEARRRGKQVTAVVELKARFDEERNINWAEELEAVGVNVVYGIVGMKIHAKLCLVVRREEKGVMRYVHIGTGNYNHSTAKIYTDMGLFTCNPDICADVTDLFNVMTGYAVRNQYRRLLVSPVNMRSGLVDLIRRETELHSEMGGGGEIVLKCNQLVDKEIIKALYKASQAGVRVHLLVRGICCLRPGIAGVSENITVCSIVGRFLEHVRAYWFRAGGSGLLYIGSADLMPRNLDRRIEVCVPVLDEEKKAYIRNHVLGWQMDDNQQCWIMQSDGTYVRREPEKGAALVNAQELLLKEASKLRPDETAAE
ncbi:MAG: polyphosphate kinase 1 [Desulfovibrionaceae bacterium]|nr:polyphosphate kinase 1 [Desulfovibrionaceae bacterium]